MRHIPDPATEMSIRGIYRYVRSELDRGMWRRVDEEATNVPQYFTEEELQEFGGTVYFYNEAGEKLL